MAFNNWIIVIISLGWYARSGQTCDNQPRIAFAIDSSQSVFAQDFKDQVTLVSSIVSDFYPKPLEIAVLLYNTQVRVNITFGQFDSRSDLNHAVSSLSFMDPITSGTDLEQLFNTTFSKPPEVFIMLKKETNATYPSGFKVPDGRLGGVKKIAVTFGIKSNIRDIADFHTVFQYAYTADFDKYSEYKKISETLCYALVSPSTSNSLAPTATLVQKPVSVSTSALSSCITSLSAFSSLIVISSWPVDEIESSFGTEQQTVQQSSLMNSPFMTSFSTVSYISTQLQHGLNETLDFASTRGWTSSLTPALVSPSTSNSLAPTATLVQKPVSVSTSALSSCITSLSAFSSLIAISSWPVHEIESSLGTKQQIVQQSSLMNSPFMTSFSTVSYISTQLQHGLNETLDFASTRERTSNLTPGNSVFLVLPSHGLENTSPLMTSSYQGNNETPALTVTYEEMKSSQAANSIMVIASSKTVRLAVTKSRNSSKPETEDFINKLLRDRHWVLNFNGSTIDAENKTHILDYFNKAASLLQLGDFLDHALKLSQQVHYESTSLSVLRALERFTTMIGDTIRRRHTANFHASFHAGGLASHVFIVDISTFEGIQIGSMDTDNGSVTLPREVFSHVATNNSNETGLLVSFVFDPFRVLQEPEAFKNFKDNHSVVSKIVNVFTRPPPLSPLSRPVKITVQHSKNGYHDPQCVFWDFTQTGISTKFGKWSKRGCHVSVSNARYTECHCDHMTNYAVLMRTTEQVPDTNHERILTVITYVGCSVSIVGVFLTVITFLSLPVIKSEITKIHLNLSIAVGVAQVLFLAAGSEKLVEKEVICKLYAGLLFYFFMSVFTWMFVEGVHLYQMIVIAFVSRSMIKFYVALGWGLPACAVIIASSIAQDGFGTLSFCWLSPVGGAIWGFVGPAIAVIAINLFVLIQVLRVRINISKQEGTNNKAQLRTSARVSLVLLPLLGLSWVFGVFAVNDNTIVFHYIFTISNSLQGLLIFAFHCVGNSEVRHEFQRKASHLNLMRTLTSPSSPVTVRARVSPIPPQDVSHNRKRDGWVGGKI